jgi:hypothetical protein
VSVLFKSDHYEVRDDAGPGVVRVVRLGVPFATIEEFHRANATVREVVQKISARRLLLDVREGPPGRNDEEFERAGERWRREIVAEFERAATLVKSAAGRLQVLRLARVEGREARVFLDEAEALRFLAS